MIAARAPKRGHLRPVAALLLALLGAAAAARAEPTTPGSHRSGKPLDPLSLIEGSAADWSASRSDAGCYLMSPYRKNTSRLAIGRHPTLGLGLFAVSFPLATKADAIEPMMVHVNGRDIDAEGRVILANLVFVSLNAAALEAELVELGDTGTLWVEIRKTWIMHDGHGVREAIAAYRSACAAANPAAAAGPVAAAGAPP